MTVLSAVLPTSFYQYLPATLYCGSWLSSSTNYILAQVCTVMETGRPSQLVPGYWKCFLLVYCNQKYRMKIKFKFWKIHSAINFKDLKKIKVWIAIIRYIRYSTITMAIHNCMVESMFWSYHIQDRANSFSLENFGKIEEKSHIECFLIYLIHMFPDLYDGLLTKHPRHFYL